METTNRTTATIPGAAKNTDHVSTRQEGFGEAHPNEIRPNEVRSLHASKRADVAERASHGLRVKRGQLSAVQQGHYGTGPAPYGYKRGTEGESPLVVDDREAEVVRTIFREYLRTRSTGKVVSYLHSKGIYTRKSNKWSRQAIAIILSNRTYRGRVSYGDLETEGLHEPIIDPALFYKANALRDRKRRRYQRKDDDDVSVAEASSPRS